MGENVNEILPGLDLQNLIQFLLAFFLTSIRLSAFLIAAPLFNAAFFMVRIRILIAMVVSVIVFSTQEVQVDVSVLTSAFGLIVIAKEIAIGATAGLILTIMFSAATLAGEKIATSAGLSYAAQVDPVSGVQTPVVSQILALFLLAVFISVDGHLASLRIIIESYDFVPIGTLTLPSALIQGGMEATGSMFLNASIIMLPVIIVVLLINVAAGIITRSAPQLNLFSFVFPITILGSFIILYFSLGHLGHAFSDLVNVSLDHLMQTIMVLDDG